MLYVIYRMTTIYNPNIGTIAKIIFKVEIKKERKKRGVSKQRLLFLSRFCQHTFPSGSYCVRLPLHCLNESQKHLGTGERRDELEFVGTTGRRGWCRGGVCRVQVMSVGWTILNGTLTDWNLLTGMWRAANPGHEKLKMFQTDVQMQEVW